MVQINDLADSGQHINKVTGVLNMVVGWVTGAINWILELPLFVKLCFLIIIIFLAYCFFEVNQYIKYLQKEYKNQEIQKGNKI